MMGPRVAADEEVSALEVGLISEYLLGALDWVVEGVNKPACRMEVDFNFKAKLEKLAEVQISGDGKCILRR